MSSWTSEELIKFQGIKIAFEFSLRRYDFHHNFTILKSPINFQTNRPKTKTALNLVADYSDNSDDETIPTKTVSSATRPLFAAAAATAPEATTNDVYSIAVQSILKSALNGPKSVETVEELPITAPAPAKKVKSTFASIITGGRSPSQDPPNDSDDAAAAAGASASINDELASIETEVISAKLLKRKRRIEFNTTRALPSVAVATMATARSSDEQHDDEATALQSNADHADDGDGSHKGDTEFSDKYSNSSETTDTAAAIVQPPDDTQNAQIKLDVCELKDTLEAKVKFLCQDRAIVLPVQIIQIQLQVGFAHVISIVANVFLSHLH